MIDLYGYDKDFHTKVIPFLKLLTEKYFNTKVDGLINIPANEKGIIVSNHGGLLPFDALILQTLIYINSRSKRVAKPLLEDFYFAMPFVGKYLIKLGALRACQENAERLLDENNLIIVFPEGIKGVGKSFFIRNKLQRFGRGGVIKLALKTKSKIIPVAISGIESVYPIIFKLNISLKPFQFPFLPVTPTFPFLGPLGLFPLPARLRVKFGKPLIFKKMEDKIIDNPVEISKMNEVLRKKIQELLKH